MLEALGDYSRQKGLLVNVGKSQVVVFNTRGNPSEQFEMNGQQLLVGKDFKYLGMRLSRSMCMKNAQGLAANALSGAAREVFRLGKEHGVLKSSAWAMVRLFKVLAMPAGMYGCQIWGTRFLNLGLPYDSDVQRRHLSFWRRLLSVPRATARQVLLAEAGCKPFQWCWFRAIVKWQHKIVGSNSPLMVDVVKADAELAKAGCKKCWSAELSDALRKLGQDGGAGNAWAECMLNAGRLDKEAIFARLKVQFEEKLWQGLPQDVRRPGIERRKLANYYAWCRVAVTGTREPPYLKEERLARARLICRFRTGGCSQLSCEAGRRIGLPWEERTCLRCDLGCVDDEYHLALECGSTVDLRQLEEFEDMIRLAGGSLRQLLQCESRTVSNYIVRIMRRVEGWQADATQGHDNASQ
jgi:hypothetical protein